MAKKPKYPPVTTEAEAAALLGELGKLKLKLDKQQNELNKAVQDLVVVANEKAEIVSNEFAEKFNTLKAYAKDNKDTLTEKGKQRSISWATGTLGWRYTPAGISVPRSSQDVALLIQRILASRKPKFLRRKWELNVEAMEASPEEATAIEGINKRAPSEIIFIKFTDGVEIKHKIKLKTPSTPDAKETE